MSFPGPVGWRLAFTAAWLAGLVLAGCVPSPFDRSDRNPADLSPADALDNPDRVGAEVLWGGRIVGIVNSDGVTDLEVLSLPLGFRDEPRRNAEAGARFVIRHPGFLEPMNYAPGRHVTAYGTYTGIESRSVGAFPVDHPVLESEKLKLWPVENYSGRSDVAELGRPPG